MCVCVCVCGKASVRVVITATQPPSRVCHNSCRYAYVCLCKMNVRTDGKECPFGFTLADTRMPTASVRKTSFTWTRPFCYAYAYANTRQGQRSANAVASASSFKYPSTRTNDTSTHIFPGRSSFREYVRVRVILRFVKRRQGEGWPGG